MAISRSTGMGAWMREKGSAWGLILEEGLALALDGRCDEALALIDEGARILDAEAGAGPWLSRLAQARVLIARGSTRDLSSARRILESIRDPGGPDAWRASLTLARLEIDEGRVPSAAAHLKDALEAFRGRTGINAASASALARMLVAEADGLRPKGPSTEMGRRSSSHHRALDSGSLLRLIELGKRLADETDPDQVLRIVLHEAIDISGTGRGFVVLVNGENLDFALAEHLDWSEIERPDFEVSRTLIRKAIEEARPIFLRLADDGPEHQAATSLAEIGARSVACVPLVTAEAPGKSAPGGAILGVLYLDGQDPDHIFTGGRERLIELLASQAAAALENARAHRAKSEALAAAEATIRRQRGEQERRERYFGLIGASEPMQDLYRKLDLIVPTEAPVLILGETGTGKELAAHLIHQCGPRGSRPFVATNCASMPETLLETELFGHERGAFTGADRPRAGLFEQADGGTIFLDEVGDMSPRMQADLLRTLQSGEVRRVGGGQTVRVDVRVIAATHRDLERMIRLGGFRQDLYFRLNVLSVSLPALRERSEDLPLLVRELLVRLSPGDRPLPAISDRAMRRLVSHPWPGNVRELENVIRRLLILGLDTIDQEDLPAEILSARASLPRASSLRRLEEAAIRRALEASRGSRTEAARALGIDRKTLYLKLKRLEFDH